MASGDPIYLSMNAKPRAIVETMDGVVKRRDDFARKYNRTRGIAPLLFLAGIPFIALDWLLGYQAILFTFVAVALWLSAIIVGIARRRGNIGKNFPVQFQMVRKVVETLRDDLSPKQNMMGYLDLTGAEKPSKLARTGKGMHQETVKFYRDNWLNLKIKLYDGNVMRVAAINRKIGRAHV